MTEPYPHLRFTRQELKNQRRKTGGFSGAKAKPDAQQHSQKLTGELAQATAHAQELPSSLPGTYFLRISYDGYLALDDLSKHGIQIVSQEDKELCVVFADEQGLAMFSERLQALGLVDSELTYKDLLLAITRIDNWTEQDRTSWALKQQGLPHEGTFHLDVELWPLHNKCHPQRDQLRLGFEHWLQTQNIQLVDSVNLDSLIIYRVQVSKAQAKLLLSHAEVRRVDLPPSSGISYQQKNLDVKELPIIQQPPESASRVCILDSGINTNHPLLRDSIGEGQNFTQSGTAMDENGHGTAVAGIALYGDLEACNAANYWVPELWLLNGKILNEDAEFDVATIESQLIEAVEYFVEHHNCKIFNLSIGNANAPYLKNRVSGMAYVLDSLAREHDVLFIVSAGNFTGSDEHEIPKSSWRDEYPEYLLHDLASIIDPAPAINALTVGSLAKHTATVVAQRYPELNDLACVSEDQPSPFTRSGPGIGGMLKPELMATGGNFAISTSDNNHYRQAEHGLGVLTCNHQFQGNTVLTEQNGTSFAAPYITHLAGRLLNNYPDVSANMLRAMLVNHANMPAATTAALEVLSEQTGRTLDREIAGYGKITEDELFRSTENVVVLMAEDAIEDDTSHFFELPLPADFLRSSRSTREIRVSLAYTPPVRTTRIEYRASRIGFRLVTGTSLEHVQKHFDNEQKNGTESLGEASATSRTISQTLREKGTVQSSSWLRKALKPGEKWFVVVTRNDYEWGKVQCDELENYALVVTVTDRENEHAQLYTQIKQQINIQQAITVQI